MSVRIPTRVIGPTTKGFWAPTEVTVDEFTAAGHTLTDGSLTFPLLTLDADALAHDVRQMADWTRDHGLEFAPHGKTTMSPEIFAAQLDAGAWGMTVATGNHLLAAYSFGVRRILVANEIVDPAVLRWIAACEDAEILFYVDSLEGVELAAESGGPVSVLLEVGYNRTGVRSHDEALAVARAVASTGNVSLRGVSAYEGGCPTLEAAQAFLADVRQIAEELRPYIDGEVVLSAGGSAYFDAVADVLRPFPGGVTILRSGSSVTHDHGIYVDSTPFNRIAGSLRPALRIWAQVLSTPTTTLALVGAGKRDVPYDAGLPVVLNKQGWTVTRTADQHAYLEAGEDAEPLTPGDLLELGISHPCTAFDKWGAIPVLDADRRVVDVVTTWF